jgi:hypothetical protein
MVSKIYFWALDATEYFHWCAIRNIRSSKSAAAPTARVTMECLCAYYPSLRFIASGSGCKAAAADAVRCGTAILPFRAFSASSLAVGLFIFLSWHSSNTQAVLLCTLVRYAVNEWANARTRRRATSRGREVRRSAGNCALACQRHCNE